MKEVVIIDGVRTPIGSYGGWRYHNPRMQALCPIISLGETAENIAQEMGISREEQDAYALESQRRAVAAASRRWPSSSRRSARTAR